MSPSSPSELSGLYRARFGRDLAYRQEVWTALLDQVFRPYTRREDTVLDLGCGSGEFINQVTSRHRLAMDLNPDTARHLASGVELLQQDCSQPWPLEDRSVDLVFTSDFFEHLPSKEALRLTLVQTHRCLKEGGRLIAMGPNIRYLPGAYWDFWDHHLPLSDLALGEGMRNVGFTIERSVAKFLPYTLSGKLHYPVALLRFYLAVPLLWRLFGRQFLIVARK
jgi:SAM-dependent methyltransferase